MEEMIDFDEWLSNYKPELTTYVAVFDPDTGAVKSVGPSQAFSNEEHKIVLNQETAEAIINCEIMIHKCFIDVESGSLEIAETKSIFKIDDVLHRITSIKYLNIAKPDIYITYLPKSKTLKIQLTEELGGTKKIKGTIKNRKIAWDGETIMDFLITEYNDPNLIFEMFSVKISELIGKTKTIKDIDYEHFSVYTRRLFKNYVIEYK